MLIFMFVSPFIILIIFNVLSVIYIFILILLHFLF